MITKEHEAIKRYVEKHGRYVAKVVLKDAEPVPIGIVVPKYPENQEEALDEVDSFFTGDEEIELWPADMVTNDPAP